MAESKNIGNDSFPQRLEEMMRAYGIVNTSELARRLGYDRAERVRNIMTGGSMPSFGMLDDIAKTFADLNMRWLLSGEGPMMMTAAGQVQNIAAVLKPVEDALRPIQKVLDSLPRTEDPQQGSPTRSPTGKKAGRSVRSELSTAAEPLPLYTPTVVTVAEDGEPNIVMLDSRAAAGLPANHGNIEFFKDKPAFRLPGWKFKGQGMIALQVSGDSMAPTVHHDDWLIARLLTNPAEEVREGYIHLVVTREGCVAKRLFRAPDGRPAVICRSDNDDYPPYEQAIGHNDQVYVVSAILSEDLSNKGGGVRERLRQVEKDVMALQGLLLKG